MYIKVFYSKKKIELAHGEVYSIQHYVIKFVSDLRKVGGFSPDTPVSSTNKTDRHDITVKHNNTIHNPLLFQNRYLVNCNII